MNLKKPLLWAVGIFLLYLLAIIAATWPLVNELGNSLPGGSSDTFMHYWNGWWVRKALASGQSPYYTGLIFYPEGISLVTHNIAWLNILPWLLVQTFLPDIVAYNVVLLLGLVLCALAAFLLVYYLTNSRLAAFMSGMIYMMWPVRVSQLDHPNLISTYWLPITMLLLLHWLRERRWRYAVAAGVSLALVGYTRWQMLIPAAFVIFVFLIVTIGSWAKSGKVWRGLIVTAAVALVLLLPPAIRLFIEFQNSIPSVDTLLQEGEELIMQTDMLAYITPTEHHPVWGSQMEQLYETYYPERSPGRRYPAYIGLITVLLAGVGLWFRRKESFPWLLVSLTLIWLAAGGILRIGGELYPQIPTLFNVLEPLYFVKLIRVPDRFNVTLALPVAVMAGYGMSAVVSRIHRRTASVSAVVLVTILVFFDFLIIPVERRDIAVSPYYHQLAEDPSSSALLNLPFNTSAAKQYMFAQATHGKPIVQGKAARIPPAAYDYIENHTLLKILRPYSEVPVWLTDVSRQMDSLAADGIGAVLLHEFDDPTWLDHWRRYLPYSPSYEDDKLVAYSTAPEAKRDFQLIDELQPGIGPVSVAIANDCLREGDVLAVDVAWGTSQKLDRTYMAQLSLIDSAGDTVQRNRSPLHPDWPSNRWPANTLVWTFLTLDTSLLSIGRYEVQLSLTPDTVVTGTMDSATASVGSVVISDGLCESDVPEGLKVANAKFGGRMRLVGYKVERAGQLLYVTLSWRMMQHMSNSYTVFVHVFEPTTGVPVAQHDSAPQLGGYPTHYWWADEPVTEDIVIYLSGVHAGEYGLAIGVYDAETSERLPLVHGDGHAVEDGRYIVPDETVTIEESNG